MTDRSRPHKFPQAALEADGDILGWKCDACGEWVREFGPTKPDECSVDWRARLDSYSQERHQTEILAARERIRQRVLNRVRRAQEAIKRLS